MTDTRGLFWSLLAPNLLAICPCQRFHPEECPPCLVTFPRGCDFHGTLPEAGSAATWAGRVTGAAQSLGGTTSRLPDACCCGSSPPACSPPGASARVGGSRWGLGLGFRTCGSVSRSLHECGPVRGHRGGRGHGTHRHRHHRLLLLLPGDWQG